MGNAGGMFSNGNTGIIAAPQNTVPGFLSRPAKRGEVVVLFCVGLGLVSNVPDTGAASSASPLSATIAPVAASVGGSSALVQFSGLSPSFVGLYQVNVLIPSDVATGVAVPVVLNTSGLGSNTVTIAVE